MSTFVINGKATEKTTKLVETLKDFIVSNFNDKGVRIGYAKFIKDFAKWNNEKMSVSANSLDLHKAIFNACYKVACDNKKQNIDLLPIFTSDRDTKISIVSFVSLKDFDKYYSDTKVTKVKATVEPTIFIMNYITKHETEIDFNVLKDFMKDFN